MIYYSAKTGGFYRDEIHGPRKVRIQDPAAVHPKIKVPDIKALHPIIEIPDPNWEPPKREQAAPHESEDGAEPEHVEITPESVGKLEDVLDEVEIPHPTIKIPDPDWVRPQLEIPDPTWPAPMIEVPNPATKIPPDAVEVSDEQHAALVNAQNLDGKEIVADVSGRPVLAERAATADQVLSRRDRLLKESDWVAMRAFERQEQVPADWRQYRDALRNVEQQAGFPLNVAWPTPPPA